MRDVVHVPLISFREVDLAFDDHLVLGKLSFEIQRGEIVCVVGPSGCGKTTALRVAAGLIAPTRGEVAFSGAPVRGPRRDVAIVFQDYSKALLPWRTAAGNVSSRWRRWELRVRNAPAASQRCWRASACPVAPTNIPRKCRAACSNGCRSRAASLRSPPR